MCQCNSCPGVICTYQPAIYPLFLTQILPKLVVHSKRQLGYYLPELQITELSWLSQQLIGRICFFHRSIQLGKLLFMARICVCQSNIQLGQQDMCLQQKQIAKDRIFLSQLQIAKVCGFLYQQEARIYFCHRHRKLGKLFSLSTNIQQIQKICFPQRQTAKIDVFLSNIQLRYCFLQQQIARMGVCHNIRYLGFCWPQQQIVRICVCHRSILVSDSTMLTQLSKLSQFPKK